MLLYLARQLRRVFVFCQELGDTEIEQLRFPFRLHQDVAGLNVAMNNQIPMRKFNRGADLQKQLQALTRRQSLRNCKSGHRRADNVVHDEVGQTIVGRACIEQPGDVWMIEFGQDLAFRSETAQDLSRVGASIQYLNRNLFLKLTISTLCQENCAHPTAAKLTDDDIRAYALSAPRRSLLPESSGCVLGTILEAVGMLLKKRLRFGQERLGLFEQIRILTTASLHQGNPGR